MTRRTVPTSRPVTTRRLVALLGAGALALSACGGGSDEAAPEASASAGGEGGGDAPLEGQSITVGSKDFDEQLVLGQITLALLEDAGADVTDSTNLAGTNAARDALTTGQIDTYWEYTGTGWISLLGNTDPIAGSQEQWDAVKAQDAEQNNITWLPFSPLDNTFAIARKADGPDLATLSDWASYITENPDDATMCVDPEFANRDDGLPGVEEAYGTTVPPAGLALVDIGVIYNEIGSDTCTFGVVSTTDGRLAANDLTTMEDDQGFFPVYNPAPTFLSDRLAELPGVEEVLAPVVEALTTEEITELNRLVSVDGERADQVAQDWLTEKGFIS